MLTLPVHRSILPVSRHGAESNLGGEHYALGAWINGGSSNGESSFEIATRSIYMPDLTFSSMEAP